MDRPREAPTLRRADDSDAAQRLATYLFLCAAAVMLAIGGYLILDPLAAVTGIIVLFFAGLALAAAGAAWTPWPVLRAAACLLVIPLGIKLAQFVSAAFPAWLRGEYASFSVSPTETLFSVGGIPVAFCAIAASAMLLVDLLVRERDRPPT